MLWQPRFRTQIKKYNKKTTGRITHEQTRPFERRNIKKMRKSKSDEQLANLAREIRELAKQLNVVKTDIKAIVSYFLNTNDKETKITLERMPGYRSKKVRAEANPSTRIIYVDDETNKAFWENRPWALAILLEEVSHIVLQHSGLRSSAIGTDLRAKNIEEVRLEESEATRLVCYLWAPIDDAYCLADKSGLVKIFGMPAELADQYWDHVKELQTQFGVKRHRQLPSNVIPISKYKKQKIASVPIVLNGQTDELIVRAQIDLSSAIESALSLVSEKSIRHNGYLSVRCTQCKKFRMRVTGNCTTCDDCGSENGCD
jgi:hypothetical protein